jgi:hypothetical protein
MKFFAMMTALAAVPSDATLNSTAFGSGSCEYTDEIQQAISDIFANLDGYDIELAANLVASVLAESGDCVFVVDQLEPAEDGGLPTSLYNQAIVSNETLDFARGANEQPHDSIQGVFRARVESTPFGAAFALDDPKVLALQLLTETSMARYLDTTDGGETYNFVCGANASNPVVRELWNEGHFNSNIPMPGPDGAQITLVHNAGTGTLEVTDATSDDAASLVLGCAFMAEEVYHAGLHFIEGSLQNSISAGVFDDDLFVKSVLNMEQEHVQAKYGEVRFLSLGQGVVWENGLPPAFTKGIIIPLISTALADFKTLNPLANIPESRLGEFNIPIRDIYQKILSTDFGYGDATYDMYVSTGNVVAAPANNLIQLQMMVALLHTDTFVWQLIGAMAPHMTDFMSLPVSSSILYNVVFPDVETCLGSTFDVSSAYDGILSASHQQGSPGEVARAALENYANWLAGYRAGGLTGIASAFSDTQCMSSTTWV